MRWLSPRWSTASRSSWAGGATASPSTTGRCSRSARSPSPSQASCSQTCVCATKSASKTRSRRTSRTGTCQAGTGARGAGVRPRSALRRPVGRRRPGVLPQSSTKDEGPPTGRHRLRILEPRLRPARRRARGACRRAPRTRQPAHRHRPRLADPPPPGETRGDLAQRRNLGLSGLCCDGSRARAGCRRTRQHCPVGRPRRLRARRSPLETRSSTPGRTSVNGTPRRGGGTCCWRARTP